MVRNDWVAARDRTSLSRSPFFGSFGYGFLLMGRGKETLEYWSLSEVVGMVGWMGLGAGDREGGGGGWW